MSEEVAFQGRLVVTGARSIPKQHVIAHNYLVLYNAYVQRTNDGLLKYLNYRWDMAHPDTDLVENADDMLAYNHFMADKLQIVADEINKLYSKKYGVKLLIDPDTLNCIGQWKNGEVRVDWESFNH